VIRIVVPDITESEIAAASKVLRSGFLVQGQQVQLFEQLFADFVGVRHAIAVSSGTAALHLALLGLNIGPGDEVVVPDFTFPASGNVVEVTGAHAILADIDRRTYNVDVEPLERCVGAHTRAIMPVHLFGLSADMDPVLDIARRHGLKVIEDAACALGATYRGRKCGALGDVGCFSFHPRKVITTGEGGMLTTNDDAMANRLRSLRNHGAVSADNRFSYVAPGLNYRLTDFQAALGIGQMQRLPAILARRRELAQIYHTQLGDRKDVLGPIELPEYGHAWQAYVVELNVNHDREAVRSALLERGVEATIGTYALSSQPAFAERGIFPNSLRAYAQTLSLPLHCRMTNDEAMKVSQTLLDILDRNG